MSTSTAAAPAQVLADSRRMMSRYLFVGLASVSMLMFAVDSSIVSVALRTLVVDLDTTLALAGWALTGYSLTQTVAMPVVGKLAEQFGEMRVFVLCVVVFILGSLLCGLATNVYMLIGCRVLQALGGGGIMPSAVSIIARLFPESRARMLGLFTSIFPIGGIIGPNVGGLLLEHFSWRVLFLVNVPVGLVVIPLLARQIAAYDRGSRAAVAGQQRRLDVVGAGLFAGAMVALLMALTFVAQDPSIVRTPTLWLTIGACIVLFALFAWQERRVAVPVIDLALVTRHPFAIVNLHNFLFGACVWGCFAFVPYYAVVQYGMSPLESGAIMTPRSITAILLGTTTSFLMFRLGYRAPIVVGLALISVSNVILGQGWDGELGALTIAPFVLMAMTVALAGVGTGLVMPAANNAVMDLLPDRAGVISGMRGMFRSTGGIIGTAVIVVALSLSEDQAAGLRMMFTAYGLLLLVAIPLTLLIPDMPSELRHRRGGRSRGGSDRVPSAPEVAGPASAGASPQPIGAAGSGDR